MYFTVPSYSLCNVLYKLSSKVVANRLKPLLQDTVTENQSAFLPKRLITDNALIALELFHTMKKRSKGHRGTIAMKLDMSKAYDLVEWVLFRRLLTKMGFAGAWVDIIMTFVSTVTYSFIINGVPLDPLTTKLITKKNLSLLLKISATNTTSQQVKYEDRPCLTDAKKKNIATVYVN